MTTPNPTFQEQVVQDMIERLRDLQGSGEYVPLARAVNAGPGLAGGGPLLADVTLSLDAESQQAIQKVMEAQWLTADAPTVAPTANRIALRTDAGNVRTGTPVDAADAVPQGLLASTVADVVRMQSGAPIKVAVVNESSHVQSNEVPGVVYIILED